MRKVTQHERVLAARMCDVGCMQCGRAHAAAVSAWCMGDAENYLVIENICMACNASTYIALIVCRLVCLHPDGIGRREGSSHGCSVPAHDDIVGVVRFGSVTGELSCFCMVRGPDHTLHATHTHARAEALGPWPNSPDQKPGEIQHKCTLGRRVGAPYQRRVGCDVSSLTAYTTRHPDRRAHADRPEAPTISNSEPLRLNKLTKK
jgi:hypothetical protein